jgi:HEAT repeat protein
MDIPVCALMSMGLIGDNAKVPDLLKWLEDGRIGRFKLSDLERAHLVSALGKIGDPQALKAITDTLKKKDKYTRRSAMIAMGQIVPQLDAKDQLAQVKKLAGYFKNEKDATARNFAVVSLGRIGGQVDVDETVRKLCVQILTKQFTDGNKTTERPYAALAMGLIAFEPGQTAVKPKELKYKLANLIRTELVELKGDKIALGAQAMALGMIGDNSKETVNLLIKILKDRGLEKKLRGSAAVALGLIGDNSAKEAILRALREREDRDLRVDTAVAAGLIGDSSAVDVLVKVLRDPKASQFVLGSVALGLGQIGDRRAIGPLKNILEPQSTDGNYPDLTRALVAVALGQIADRRDIRVLARISKDVNYRAIVPALDEVLTVL